jgi:hypothetical protein
MHGRLKGWSLKQYTPNKNTTLFMALARSALFYSNESQAIRKIDERRLKSAEICFMRIAGYTLLDSRINEEIVREVRSPQIVGFIKQHGKNWLLMRWQDKLQQG